MTGMFFLWYPLARKTINASLNNFIYNLLPILISSAFMAGSIYFFKLYWHPVQQPTVTAITVFLGISILSVSVYVLSIYIFQLLFKFNISRDIKLIYKSLVE
jgi:hypothetical protein